jgi:hypothetical protein
MEATPAKGPLGQSPASMRGKGNLQIGLRPRASNFQCWANGQTMATIASRHYYCEASLPQVSLWCRELPSLGRASSLYPRLCPTHQTTSGSAISSSRHQACVNRCQLCRQDLGASFTPLAGGSRESVAEGVDRLVGIGCQRLGP